MGYIKKELGDVVWTAIDDGRVLQFTRRSLEGAGKQVEAWAYAKTRSTGNEKGSGQEQEQWSLVQLPNDPDIDNTVT